MPAEALLSLSTSANKADFYIFRNGIIEGPFHTGNLAVWSEKSGFKRANAIPFTLESGEEVTIYQKRYNSIAEILPTNLRIRILNTTKLIQSELKDYETHYIQKEHIYRSFFAGVFTLAFILNFLIYFESKDKTQLYFSLFLFFFSVAFNSILTAILSRDSIWVLQAVDTSAGFSYVFFMYFVRHYFAIGNFYPRWDKFIHSVSISFFCIIILSTVPIWVDNSTFIKIRQIIAIVFFLSLIVTIILCLRKKREQTKVFIVAILPFIISIITIIVWALYFYGSTTDRFPFIVDSIVGVCVVWAVIVFSAFLLKRYSRQEKKILNDTLEKEQERNDFIAEQKVQLEKQVKERTAELIASQNQLIQSEKLASLGELTAGIAHEIQNPLNFVNNFSELSVELIDELKSPLTPKGGTLEAELLSDISQNLEKINHHGKRASNIVKGMLEHSRASTGMKELTDINKLADEYLRLSYHGLRAKDKDFNADFTTHFDENLPKIEVIPQDIGRVLLNLINNAFYAVAPQPPKGEQEVSALSRLNNESYVPTVTVSTHYQAPPLGAGGANTEGAIIIKVKDNGIGMSEAVRAKVFQPFFTTKPTGQGTGLGLSLAYDIVTKGHGGALEVESTEGVGSEFIITLPFKTI